MRSKLIIIIVSALLVVACIGLIFTPRKKPVIVEDESILEELPQKSTRTIENYYPVVQNQLWQYTVKERLIDQMDVSIDYIKDNVFQVRYKRDDKTIIKVFVLEDDALYEVAQVEDSFIKNDYTRLRQYKDVVLKAPLEEGTSWLLQDGAIRTITAIDEMENTSDRKSVV